MSLVEQLADAHGITRNDDRPNQIAVAFTRPVTAADGESVRLALAALSRVTVEGLAGVMREANISGGGGYRVASISNPEAKAIAQALVSYINGGKENG